MAITTSHGVGFGVKPILNPLEGQFGIGFTIGANLTLDVKTVIGGQVARNTTYNLTYVDPADGQPKVVSILHDPSIPFQSRLPENVVITLTVPSSATYQTLVATVTILPNASPVLRVRLAFNRAYARMTIKRYH